MCRYDPQGNYPNQLPYPAAAQSSQAVGEEESALTPPFQDGVGDSGGGDTSGDSGGGDTSGDSGGGDTSGDSGGGDTERRQAAAEILAETVAAEILAETVAAEILAETVAEIKRGQMSPLFLFQFCIIVS